MLSHSRHAPQRYLSHRSTFYKENNLSHTGSLSHLSKNILSLTSLKKMSSLSQSHPISLFRFSKKYFSFSKYHMQLLSWISIFVFLSCQQLQWPGKARCTRNFCLQNYCSHRPANATGGQDRAQISKFSFLVDAHISGSLGPRVLKIQSTTNLPSFPLHEESITAALFDGTS